MSVLLKTVDKAPKANALVITAEGEGVPFSNFEGLEKLFEVAGLDTSLVKNRNNVGFHEYVVELIRQGKPFPSHPSRLNKLSIPTIARESGLSKNYFKDPIVRTWIETLLPEIGLGPRLKDDASCDLPLGAFRDKACRHLERILQDAGKADAAIRAALDNFKTALNLAAGPNREFAAMPALAALQAAVDRLWRDKPKGAKNLKADLNRAIKIHREFNQAPKQFSEVLRNAMTRAGVTPYAVAQFMEVSRSTVTNWLDGTCCPDPSRKKKFSELERTLSLRPGELVSLIVPYRNGIGIGRIDRDDYPEEFRAKPWLHAAIKRSLPSNYFELGKLARQQAMTNAVARLSDRTTPERKKREEIRRDSYILKGFTPLTLQEFNDISGVFKSGQIPTSDLSQSKKTWKDVTRDKCNSPRARRFFGALNSGRICADGITIQIPLEHLTFGLLLWPQFLRHVLFFKQTRNAGNKDHLYLTRADLSQVYFARSLCHPTDGWIKDHPEIVDRLQPVPGVFSQADIDAIRGDLVAACGRAYAEYGRIIDQRRKKLEIGTDSKAPVEQILRKGKPLSALKMIVTGLLRQLRALPADSIAAATLQRRIVLVCLLSQLALRRGTLNQIKVSLHLFKEEDGSWCIKMPAGLFKNYRSTHWGSKESNNFFYRRLKDRWGFYAVLQQYLNSGRKLLLGGAKSDALFVGARGAPALTPERLGDDFRDLTEEFLARNETSQTGIKGVVPFGPHLVRHILATAILKDTNGDYQAAADSIHDTIPTVKKYYAMYLPGDRRERLESAVDQALDCE